MNNDLSNETVSPDPEPEQNSMLNSVPNESISIEQATISDETILTAEKTQDSFQPKTPEYSFNFKKIFEEWKRDEKFKYVSTLFFVPMIVFFVISFFLQTNLTNFLNLQQFTFEERLIISDILTFIIISFPIIIAAVLFQKNIFSPFMSKPKVPKRPFMTAFFVLGVGFLSSIILAPITSILPTMESTNEYFRSPLAIILTVIQIALIPAIFEEWLFRGMLLKHLLPMNRSAAIIISGIMFGMMHQNPTQAVFAAIFGMLLGVVYVNSGCNIWLTMLIHFINNAYSLFTAYIYDKFPMGSVQYWWSEIPIYICIAITFGCLMYYVFSGKKAFFTLKESDEIEPYETKHVIKKILTTPTFYIAIAFMILNQVMTMVSITYYNNIS
ncbi:MAG: hypothetical protein A2Y17_06945 [Clostridiales bacterium GWF2_38_85]|nr:MAG: hypothetical protein A2Y17_06945 [Clostridiales bacterium GWF2_38_85]HBL84954.1 hypothetical protein [Clostridiales bacterium]